MNSPQNIHRLSVPVGNCDHRQGNRKAQIKLVMYGDYQCPESQAAEVMVKGFLQTLGDDLEYIFRHFPQENIHPESGHAAEAAEAAGSQGRFWEMHNYLFASQSQLSDSHLVECAIALQLNVDQFLQEITSDRHVPRIAASIISGRDSFVSRTPTFFINDVKYEGSFDGQAFLSAIRNQCQ